MKKRHKVLEYFSESCSIPGERVIALKKGPNPQISPIHLLQGFAWPTELLQHLRFYSKIQIGFAGATQGDKQTPISLWWKLLMGTFWHLGTNPLNATEGLVHILCQIFSWLLAICFSQLTLNQRCWCAAVIARMCTLCILTSQILPLKLVSDLCNKVVGRHTDPNFCKISSLKVRCLHQSFLNPPKKRNENHWQVWQSKGNNTKEHYRKLMLRLLESLINSTLSHLYTGWWMWLLWLTFGSGPRLMGNLWTLPSIPIVWSLKQEFW